MDDYINKYDGTTKEYLLIIKNIIKEIIPDAKEVISYNMPTFKLNDNAVYFAACKGYIGFYPTNKPIEVFKDRLTDYKTTKRSIHFKLDEKLPIELIKDIVSFIFIK